MLVSPNETRANWKMAAPVCKVSQSSNPTISTASLTAITFDTDIIDPYGMHSTSSNTNRITIVVPGTYWFFAKVVWANDSTGNRTIAIRDNAAVSLVTSRRVAAQNSEDMIGWLAESRASGDWFEMTLLQTSGGDLVAIPRFGCMFVSSW